MEESKFNFEENIDKDQAVEQSKTAVKQDARGLIKSVRKFLRELLDFRRFPNSRAHFIDQ